LDQCPTNAFVAPEQMDARKCISYLTIEHTGVIEKNLAVSMGDWIFGCDVCQDVCPHNHRKMLSMHADLAPRQQLAWLDIAWLFAEKEEKILDVLAGTPLRRTGIAKLQRNAVVVVYNHMQKETTVCEKLLEIFRHSAQPLVQKQLQELDWL
jgi:epoxyqueuosine reductase